MEQWNGLALQSLTEIDQQVAATDQVQVGKWGVSDHVLPRKNAHLANRLVDAVAPVHPDEESPQPLVGNVRLDGFRIPPRPGLLQCPLMNVRAENLCRMMQVAVRHELHQDDGD